MASVRRKMSLSFVFHICLLLIQCSWGRDHSITLEDEERRTFELSKFGFLQGGVLKVNFTDMVFKEKEGNLQNSKDNFGFSLEKTTSDGISPYMEQHAEKCILKNGPTLQERISVALIKFDLKSETIVIERFGEDFLNLTVVDVPLLTTTAAPVSTTSASTTAPPTPSVEQNNSSTASTSQNTSTTVQSVTSSQNSSTTVESVISTKPVENSTPATTVGTPEPTVNNSRIAVRRKREVVTTRVTPAQGPPITLPLTVTTNNESKKSYSGRFIVYVNTKAEEGLYNLYFHNCANYNDKKNVKVNIKIQIKEKNHENYLSAGEEPLPYMFGVLSVIFLVTAVYWFRVLRQNREYTYKVHYMMFVLVLLKALDLAFQAVNNHFISRDGKPAESWAVLYYITHLLKGALLFTTIVLIGTGYFFVKHVLSDRDKKIFIIVIPLQILANTAQIVMESTEEAKLHYTTWKEVFILVDLLCCGAILFPVVWSIRHLQEASQTDGKAAINLAKLKLFRHFYVMIVCYIYFTRIIVYLIKITVPFQYMWLDDFFNNVASYVFFVLTGYKFRPAPDNPYLHVPQEESDEEIDMEEVVTTAGLAKGVTRLQPSSDGRKIFETA